LRAVNAGQSARAARLGRATTKSQFVKAIRASRDNYFDGSLLEQCSPSREQFSACRSSRDWPGLVRRRMPVASSADSAREPSVDRHVLLSPAVTLTSLFFLVLLLSCTTLISQVRCTTRSGAAARAKLCRCSRGVLVSAERMALILLIGAGCSIRHSGTKTINPASARPTAWLAYHCRAPRIIRQLATSSGRRATGSKPAWGGRQSCLGLPPGGKLFQT